MTETTRIPAYSRKQAMDWSLVLASQDLGATILRTDDGNWALEVDAGDHGRAMEAIRLYRLENRGWAWQQHLPWPGISFHYGSIAFCVLLALVHIASDEWRLHFLGMMNNHLVHQGEWWRPITAVFLHADLAHLMSNLVFGVIALGLSMARFGGGLGLLGALLGGIAGNLLGLAIYGTGHRGLGASGMMMGALGLVTVHYIAYWREHPQSTKLAVKALMAGGAMFLLFGVDPSSDVLAHFGGFVAGCLLGGLLSATLGHIRTPRPLDIGAFLVFATAVIAAWTAAIRN